MTFSGVRRQAIKICRGAVRDDGVERLPEQAIGTVAPMKNARE
ncbi:hypothetical protein [Pseudomonas petrae]|nr:hypothetical protein [Pseudomonas petrae]